MPFDDPELPRRVLAARAERMKTPSPVAQFERALLPAGAKTAGGAMRPRQNYESLKTDRAAYFGGC
jgi:hypothetical protein